MNANEIIMAAIAVFFVIGTADRCLNGRFGFSGELERGFDMLGVMALNVVGVVCIAPLMAQFLQPVVLPMFSALGADPAMFSGCILSPDSGGYSIAAELSEDPDLIRFSGLLVSMVLGTVVCFTVPVSCGLLEQKEDIRFFAVGVLAAFAVSPFTCLFGGVVMGLSLGAIVKNLLPVLIVAGSIILGLILIPGKMVVGFRVFAQGLRVVVMLGLVLGAVKKMTGVTLIDGVAPIEQGFGIIGAATLTIAGALPLLYFLQTVGKRGLEWLGGRFGLSDACLAGMVVSMVTFIPAVLSFRELNVREKVLLSGVIASVCNMIGAPLGYIAAVDRTMIVPMVLAKLFSGALTLSLCFLIGRNMFPEQWRRREREGERTG